MKNLNNLTHSLVVLVAMNAGIALAAPEKKSYPEVYPFVPFSEAEVVDSVKRVSEDQNAYHNIFDIHAKGLNSGKTTVQPWMSTYWPLNKGLIADPYTPKINVTKVGRELSWKRNYALYQKRKVNVHEKIDSLSNEELEKLAPSEKYDLLLGDKTFDLTNKIWDYAYKWGDDKENSFISSLDIVGGGSLEMANNLVSWGYYNSVEEALPRAIEMRGGLAENIAISLVEGGKYENFVEALPSAIVQAEEEASNYVIKKKNSMMALWEGICHGWSTAAGIVPRPKHTVDITLPTGKRLRFFPDDLKALASFMWANSLVQDSKFIDENGEAYGGGIISEGLRCNYKSPSRDEWGRFYDSKPDQYSKKLEPRCVGVHPAIWHMALVNIMGNQGRSFIVDRKVKAAVDNHPLAAYKSEFFNPKTGKYGSLVSSIEKISDFDPYINFRNKKAESIVGIKLTMTYINWSRPTRDATDSESKDDHKDIDMMYDLELDHDGNIVGGQWRLTEKGTPVLGKMALQKNTQPDFFWVVTKDWKKFFKEANVTPWTDTKVVPPSDWLEAAKGAHAFKYQQTHEFGFNDKCKVVNGKKVIEVPCEHKVDKPQPLINVVNTLIELSRK